MKDQIEDLQKRLNSRLGGYVGNGFRSAQRTAPRRTRRAMAKGEKTVAGCVLQALGNETLPVKKSSFGHRKYEARQSRQHRSGGGASDSDGSADGQNP